MHAKHYAAPMTALLRRYAHFEGDAPPPANPDPATPPANNGGSNGEGDNPAWLPARLQRAAEQERKRLLAEMGVDDPAKAKQLIAAEQKRQQDEMTDAQKAQAEVAQLKPKAERADALEAKFREMAQKRIDTLPKQWQAAVQKLFDNDPIDAVDWLDANAALFALPAVPNLNAGDQGDKGKKPVELTPEQKDTAKRLRIPEDKYAAELRKGEPRRS